VRAVGLGAEPPAAPSPAFASSRGRTLGRVDRCVAHVDMDAFYVSVELRRRPELRGLPVVVAGSGPRAVVTTASYEARRFGVGSAIPAARARRLCPDAVWVAPDFGAYRDVSREVMDIVRAEVETVEVVGLDEAYVDLGGLGSPHAAMRRLVARIREETGLGCSVGIGPSKLVAKVASDAEKPGGFVVLTGEEARARFASAPPGLLPGIGPKTAARLEAMGIATLAALADAPEPLLAERFGARLGPWLRRRARFEDGAPVSSSRVAISESRETTFPNDLSDPGELAAILTRLSGELCGALRRQGRRGRTVGIKVRLDDFSTHTRARTMAQAQDDADRIGGVARELLLDFAPRRPVRLLGVRVAGLEAAASADDQLALPM
jgi:DNA polymerase IV